MDVADPTVSIVIPVYNQRDLTEQCIASIFRCLGSAAGGALQVEVVVVDNGSFDGTREWFAAEARTDPRVTLRYSRGETNQGFARGVNAGAALATGEYLVFLNNDTEVLPGAIELLIRTLREHSGIGIAGARLLYPDHTIQHAGMAFDGKVWHHVFRGFPAEHPAVLETRSFQAVTGACLVMRRDLFERVGPFDEAYTNGYEDVDLCQRVIAAGKSVVYVPGAVLYHYESVSQGRELGDHGNRTRFLARWGATVHVDYATQTDRYLAKAVMKAEVDLTRFQQEHQPYRAPDSTSWQRYQSLVARVIMLREGIAALANERLQADLHALRSTVPARVSRLVRRMTGR